MTAPSPQCQPRAGSVRLFALAAVLMLAGCGEPASTYDPKRGRYVDTQEYRRDEINRAIDKREAERERER